MPAFGSGRDQIFCAARQRPPKAFLLRPAIFLASQIWGKIDDVDHRQHDDRPCEAETEHIADVVPGDALPRAPHGRDDGMLGRLPLGWKREFMGALRPSVPYINRNTRSSVPDTADGGRLCSSERGFRLPPELVLPTLVAAGKMQRHQPGHAGPPYNRARLRRGEMTPRCRQRAILLEEGGLDEELIGAARELDDSGDVDLVMRGIDHIGDLLPGRDAQRMLLERAERNGRAAAHQDRPLVRRSPPDRDLGFVEPRPDRKPKRIEPLPPYIDPQPLAEGEGQARRSMVQHGTLDAKFLLVEQHAGRQRRDCELAPAEGFPGAEFAPAGDPIFADFRRGQHEIERVFPEQVPGIGPELVLDLVGEAVRTEETKRRISMQAYPQQPIEPREVVHVSVRHEYVAYAQQLAR